MGQMELLREDRIKAVSSMLEIGAYETLWVRLGTTFHRLANRFRDRPGALPSHIVDHGEAFEMAKTVASMLRRADADRFDVQVHGILDCRLHLRRRTCTLKPGFTRRDLPIPVPTGQLRIHRQDASGLPTVASAGASHHANNLRGI